MTIMEVHIVKEKKEVLPVAKPIDATPTLYGQDADQVIVELMSKSVDNTIKAKKYMEASLLFKKMKK